MPCLRPNRQRPTPLQRADRRIEEEILPFCRDNTIGILAYSPLRQGCSREQWMLTGNSMKGDQRRTKPLFAGKPR